ncbi:hypothetical protein BX611_1845 [Lutibacter oceani]|uniref:Oxygen tolerance protein BatD n=1 Tax=Lutibacter oceani TaxID=1853311 RepID=A0A3D9RS37_9FLAO|nr:hypothetical protein [Lutibacter oceani]REE82298.1 hypothetical protein BX611_1845 [Lutibacter oceani]
MKNQFNIRKLFLILPLIFTYSLVFQQLNAQNDKKNSIRISVNYVKIMNEKVFFEIKTTSKINKKTIGVPNLDLTVYNEFDNTSILLSRLTTDMDGKSIYHLENLNSIQTDSTNLYTIKIYFEGNESFKKTHKIISLKDADINAKLITKDSVNYIIATLRDKATNKPIESEPLTIQVQRLFRPFELGKKLNFTDENGTINIPIENKIPAVDGILTFEVVLKEHDDYGTVKALIKAPIGVPIVEESTFNERTMWSPRNKTPIFLLIIPNLLTFGMWSIIIYLIVNLFKILKSST